MSPLGQGNLADLKEAEIWEGFLEEEAFLRVKLGIAEWGRGLGRTLSTLSLYPIAGHQTRHLLCLLILALTSVRGQDKEPRNSVKRDAGPEEKSYTDSTEVNRAGIMTNAKSTYANSKLTRY